jgi:hypothetical protein
MAHIPIGNSIYNPRLRFVLYTTVASAIAATIIFIAYQHYRLIEPAASQFCGKTGGCGHFLVYRYNQSQTMAVAVTVIENAITFDGSQRVLNIEDNDAMVKVRVLQFPRPSPDYFCSDLGGFPKPIATWQGTAGTLTVEREEIPPPRRIGNPTHRVSVYLRNATIRLEGSTAITHLDSVDFKDALVGEQLPNTKNP